ncbi:MAG: ssl1498 family light-harvesting-like protein [Cyanobacteria bacterium P01_F01_bin.53]
MYTTTDETGRLNNYATEPQMYFASYPSPEQQRSYLVQGGIATALVVSLLTIAACIG